MKDNAAIDDSVIDHYRSKFDWAGGKGLKKKYRRSDVDAMEDLVDVIARSSNHNEVARRSSCTWYNWEAFVDGLFKPMKGITTFQHFRFASSSAGVVFVREAVDALEKEVRLLKVGVSVADVKAASLPEELHDAGMSTKRKEDLYKEVRELVAEGRKDVLCACPEKDHFRTDRSLNNRPRDREHVRLTTDWTLRPTAAFDQNIVHCRLSLGI